MAELTVDVIRIDEVKSHPNADRLDMARVGGYWVVVGKDEYVAGDVAVYFPVDSVLPQRLEEWIFKGTNMSLKNGRVRAAKIRGYVSHGLLASSDTILDHFVRSKRIHRVKVGDELTKALQVTKHQPPVKAPRGMQVSTKKKGYSHGKFRKYTSINHLQKYHTLFEKNEIVFLTEKLHGTNFRAGWVPFEPKGFIGKLKIFLGLEKREWEFVFGSHNVQLTNKSRDSVYSRIVESHDLMNKIPKGQIWYGEIIGNGIQNNYTYGYDQGEIDVFFIDVMDSKTGVFLNFNEAQYYVTGQSERMVPAYVGKFNLSDITELLNKIRPHSALHGPTFKEGLVIRAYHESTKMGQRKILKLISDHYMLQKGNTDFH